MRQKILAPLFISILIIIVASMGFSLAAAEPALQPFPETSTPQEDAAGTPSDQPSLVTVAPLAAQDIDLDALDLEDGWQILSNLSRSGGTSNSQLIVDSNGTVHVFWSDAVEAFGYTKQSGETWSRPVAAEYPFFTRRYFPDLRSEQSTPLFKPVLAAAGQGQISAFWIDDGVLYSSSVPSGAFTDYDSWSPRLALADKALVVSTATGPDGRLHLLYIRHEESDTHPAGVYYQQLNAAGSLEDPILLYASRYLRTVPAGEANLQLLASAPGSIYAVWDDTLKQQIFFARSTDNGNTWDIPQEIDRRQLEDADNSAGPSRITLGAQDDQLHLSWSAGHEFTELCSQYTSTSADGGTTWTTREAITTLPLCFANAQFVAAGDTLLLLGTIEEEGARQGDIIATTYLLARDGSRWSEPQIQEALSNFANPETNQAVQLHCHSGFNQGNSIALIGCDSAAGSDTWLLNREVGDIETWFPPPPEWDGPDEVNSVVTNPLTVQMVSSRDGSLHAFWNAENSPRIFRAGWDGEGWNSTQEAITSPGGSAASLAAAYGADKLYLVWEDAAQGLQFSNASISNPTQWSDPASFPGVHLAASAPSIIADEGGNVFLAYAVQLNEERGIYLVHSADAGETWSTPLKVFDGALAGWDMVDKPIVTQTGNGQMHLMWTRRAFPPASVPLGLAYSRSEDLGQTWSVAETVVEAQSAWSALEGTGERFVHRLWSEENGDRSVIRHSYTLDGGLSWSQSEQIMGLSSESILTTAVDPAQRPHILTLENGQLDDLIWEGERWAASDSLDTALAGGGNLAAAANHAGQIVAVYAGNMDTEDSEELESRLFAMGRTLDLPQDLVVQLPTLTPTPPPTAPPPPTTTPVPTATVIFSTQREQSGLGEIPGTRGLPVDLNLIVAFIPVLIIVGLGILIGFRLIRKQ